jgi:hypothetical protein
MSDNLNDRGPQDASKVNVNEDWEVAYWTRKFGVTADQLKQAVKQVGTSADKLGQHFNK